MKSKELVKLNDYIMAGGYPGYKDTVGATHFFLGTASKNKDGSYELSNACVHFLTILGDEMMFNAVEPEEAINLVGTLNDYYIMKINKVEDDGNPVNIIYIAHGAHIK